MNISSVQSSQASLFTKLSQVSGKALRTGDEFRSQKPMSNKVAGGRDRDRSPMPAEKGGHTSGPMPREGDGNVANAAGSRFSGPLPAEQLNDITGDRGLRGGRGSRPMPAQKMDTPLTTTAMTTGSKPTVSIDFAA